MTSLKRIFCAMLASCVMLTGFAGCGQTQQSEVDSSASSTDSQVSSAAPDSGDNIIDSGKVNLFDFVDANASASVVDVNEALGLKGVKVESDPFDSGWVENSDTLTRTKETKFKLNISSTTGYTGLVFYIKLPKTGTGKNMIAVHVDDYPTLTTKISAFVAIPL